MPWRCMNSFAKILLPSSSAAAFEGPTIARLRFANSSAMPRTSGSSGPTTELPLVRGIADEFAKRSLAIVGPSKAAAELEGSKIFAKEFMQRHGIPTASPYGIFNAAVDAYGALCSVDWPVVVKADGLCAGKGVLVTSSPDEATAFIERAMEKREFGDAGNRLLLEEGLSGQELSYIVLTDGDSVLPLAPTRDHKRVFDGDEGPNTGG